MRSRRTPQPETNSEEAIADFRYADKSRKNIPPAGLAAQGKVRETAKTRYEYDPHLPPVLRFDPSGKSDALPELLETAKQRALTPEEAQTLADALKNREPYLEWAGKREQKACEVDPVALHIHERVSAQAIIRVAAREDIPRNLFADPEQEYREAVQFYQHDVLWSNRLILGDSLQVMASLAKREDLAGKVQMIYLDPPYGIKYASNFQSEVGKRDVKDRPEDLTREQETVKAYRDTWNLGVHSYLSYLRDRLTAAKELLTDSGSIFVQISDENLHRVRLLMDEVFGVENFGCQIAVKKTSPLGSAGLTGVVDYLLWYGKHKPSMRFNQLYKEREQQGDRYYTLLQFPDGHQRPMTPEEFANTNLLPKQSKVLASSALVSSGLTVSCVYTFEYRNRMFNPSQGRSWRTNIQGMERIRKAERLISTGETLRYISFFDDFALEAMYNFWGDTGGGAIVGQKVYVVQTPNKIIERCLLMTTDPGDLVLDPTCGSGTTAAVAEQWGRRWITIDSSRVALAIARQRLLTAKFDMYEFKEPAKGVSGGFVYKSVPHITLKSIAQNTALDPVFAKWAPILAEKLGYLNLALAEVTTELRRALQFKLALKEKTEGKKAITDADRRRWLLPERDWKEWEVPFDTDPDWSSELQEALTDYRTAWRSKMDAVNAIIAASAEPEELVDQPKITRNVLRVSGPFTVEGVIQPEETLDLGESPIVGEPEELEAFDLERSVDVTNADAYLSRMIKYIKDDGVQFPDNKRVKFSRLEPLSGGTLHAEGEWGEEGVVAIVFGPQVGSISAKMVEECLTAAFRKRIYTDIVFAGFSFDAAAQAVIQDDPNPSVKCHLAHIRPDVQMNDLLKTTPNSQIFTVFGLPRVAKKRLSSGEWQVTMEGVDIYDPLRNSLHSTTGEKVAAWFLDSDYDGACFCITQAFFPDSTAWARLSKALTGVVDPERFSAFSGTTSLPFPEGKYRRAAVKVISPRGEEVLRVIPLTEEVTYA